MSTGTIAMIEPPGIPGMLKLVMIAVTTIAVPASESSRLPGITASVTSIARKRVEPAKAVVRPAYAGVSAVILPTGEVAPGALDVGPVDPDLAPDPAEPPRLLLAEVPRLRGLTPYTRFGDLFAYACAAFTAAALVAAARGRRARAR